MMVFLYIVCEPLLSISAATNSELDPVIRGMIVTVQIMIAISWCTCPVVYLLPMLGINTAQAVVFTQADSCAHDVISKCSVGPVTFGFSYQYAAEPQFFCVRLVSVYGLHMILYAFQTW